MSRHGSSSGKGPLGGMGRRRLAAVGTAVVLGVGGVATLGYAFWGQQSASDGAPVAQSSTSPSPDASRVTPTFSASDSASALPESEPTSVSIPAIDVDSEIFPLGLNPNGTMAVPQPGPRYDLVSWFKYSPTPGELGPATLTGHIDSAENGPSVFYNLDDLEPGNKVRVTRQDGTVAEFAVDRVEDYPKDEFPTNVVYGNTSRPELRLITCGGSFNDSIGHYSKNIVAFAHLTGSQSA